eukprot:SAG22_NODE_2753_length_2248_cov_1.772452_3_plen_84_part_00
MLKRAGIDIDETSTRDREAVASSSPELHEYPLLKALFRWRRTLNLLATIPGFAVAERREDSLLNLFQVRSSTARSVCLPSCFH